MRRKFFQVILLTFSLFLLSACNGVDDLVDSATKFLDSFTEGENENNANHSDSNNNQENNDLSKGNEENNHEDDDNHTGEENNHEDPGSADLTADTDSSLPFDERLVSQGYDLLTVPNGFPYEVPYHWIYVKDSHGNKDHDGFLGSFCFDLPLPIEDVANHFEYFEDVEQIPFEDDEENILHKTSFTLDFTGEPTRSHVEFYLDEFGNTCADATVDANLGTSLGEDPSTMEDDVNDDVEMERSLPENYGETLEYVRNGGELEALVVGQDEIISIRDRFMDHEMEMLHLANGHPTIFPYEWYLVSKIDMNQGWVGNFCTDRPMNEAIIKHHDMLTDHHANIEFFSIEESPKPNIASETGFSFNDEYGTGSWTGVSMFYASPEGEYPFHNCVHVEMEFSAELID